MAERKRRSFLRRDLEYMKDYTVSVSGETIYTGPLYAFNGDPEEHRALFRRFAVLSGAMVVLMLVCGFLRVAAMSRSSVVTLAYGFGLLACFALLVSCLRLVRSKQPMERRAFDTSFARLRWLPGISAVLAAAAIIAALVFVFTRRDIPFRLPDGVFLAGQAAVAVMGAAIFLSAQGLLYHVIEPETAEAETETEPEE